MIMIQAMIRMSVMLHSEVIDYDYGKNYMARISVMMHIKVMDYDYDTSYDYNVSHDAYRGDGL